MTDTRPIRFHHRGSVQTVAGAPTTRSLLEWLREDQRCTGSKEGCNEGDCGACTVIVAELATEQDRKTPGATLIGSGDSTLRLRNLNACLTFLPTLDGKALITVEDLPRACGLPAGQLHPAQQAMVDCHGSQCGFCTPGFVMTMATVHERQAATDQPASRATLSDDLAGNLCRCTGYRPILDAAMRLGDATAARIDAAPIAAALQALAHDAPLHYAAQNPAVIADGIARTDHFHAPRTVAELAALRLANPQARLLAGATDIGLWVNKLFRDLGELHFIGEVAELKRLAVIDGALHIGAAVSLEDAWSALATATPELTEVWKRFASPPVRHAGTLGGNIANGSPIGDGAPVLMALDAQLVLRLGDVTRTVALKDFYLGYMVNALAPGEFIQELRVPLPDAHTLVRVWKVSKRYDSDISALCGAFALKLDANSVIGHVRLAWGGLAATVKRAVGAEVALLGQPWNEATLQAAQVALAQEFQPLDDLRASAAYRRTVAANLLRRLWLETRLDAPLDATHTRVWNTANPTESEAA
ncbi:xanthine dehydrogenase, small subunit [Leptothrix cholodnii SP-6]|uniref:Xanthine dehydrogenase, small subunit n=1 Tax=Leptothrix cholodnii (strain ATCC 51168 / LMG 8142 / SP-6) TaxID=395495 RepID=B1Y3L5_LEPCP|nr:xanthine dehydrogenase small subunit [Leptothrix cholodnii]ACB35718.1 xanthine dehydrogenase, small subunit [Leptothrix cholodnii SP-6]